jgi:hypothetical protein
MQLSMECQEVIKIRLSFITQAHFTKWIKPQKRFSKALKEDFNIDFHQLFAITNLPIAPILDYLIALIIT